MPWYRKRERTQIVADIDEARRLRDEASAALQSAEAQAPRVIRLTDRIIERRKKNHFGDELQITFTPRGHSA